VNVFTNSIVSTNAQGRLQPVAGEKKHSR